MPKFRCEHCRQKIVAPDDYVGRRVRCPRCKQAVRVPEIVEAAALAPPPVADTDAGGQPAASAAPFARDSSAGSPFAHRSQADAASLFDPSAADGADRSDLAPEEQTQVFWHMHEVAAYHEPAGPAAVPPRDFFAEPSDPAEPTPTAPPRAEQTAGVGPAPRTDPEVGPPPAPPEPPVIVEPAEVIDVPVRRQRPGLNSVDEVADLLRRLDRPAARARLAAEWVADVQQRQPPPGSRWIGVLGWLSAGVGLAAIGVTFVPPYARFAVPAGATGLVLAMAALVIALGKRARVFPSIGGAVVSAGGVVLAILVARGVLPLRNPAARPVTAGSTPPVTLAADVHPAAAGTPDPSEYVPATSPLIANNVEVRVVSALVLRPAVYTGDYSALHTADDPRLQITLALKRVGTGAGGATYEPWRKPDEGSEQPTARVTDAAGVVLALDERPIVEGHALVPLPAGALRGTVSLGPLPAADVLLFEAPTGAAAGPLLLDLPGRNIGAPGISLHIRIPAEMVRVQRAEAANPAPARAP